MPLIFVHAEQNPEKDIYTYIIARFRPNLLPAQCRKFKGQGVSAPLELFNPKLYFKHVTSFLLIRMWAGLKNYSCKLFIRLRSTLYQLYQAWALTG